MRRGPIADLARWVEAVWIDTAAAPLPYPAVDLLVFGDGTMWLAGAEVRVRTGPLPPGGPLVGLRLRAGACLDLLGIAADEVPLLGTPYGQVSPGSPRERLRGAITVLRGGGSPSPSACAPRRTARLSDCTRQSPPHAVSPARSGRKSRNSAVSTTSRT